MKKILTFLAIIVISIVGWKLFILRIQSLDTPTPKPYLNYIRHAAVEITPFVNDSKRYNDVEFTEGQTALDVTKKVAKVEMKGEGGQAFVISINERHVDEKKKEFWSLSINGKDSEVVTGSYIVQAGDVIAWKIKTR